MIHFNVIYTSQSCGIFWSAFVNCTAVYKKMTDACCVFPWDSWSPDPYFRSLEDMGAHGRVLCVYVFTCCRGCVLCKVHPESLYGFQTIVTILVAKRTSKSRVTRTACHRTAQICLQRWLRGRLYQSQTVLVFHFDLFPLISIETVHQHAQSTLKDFKLRHYYHIHNKQL